MFDPKPKEKIDKYESYHIQNEIIYHSLEQIKSKKLYTKFHTSGKGKLYSQFANSF